MAKASDNVFPKVILGPSGVPAAPADGSWRLYSAADGVYARSSNTTVGPFGASGATVATDAIWDAAGDLALGTGANTASRLAIGANGYVLTSNGTTATWAAAASGGMVAYDTATRTAGNVTFSSTSYADVDSGIDLVVAATAGDILLVGLSGFWQNESDFGALDGATWVSAAAVNYISGNGSGGNGVQSWRGISGAYTVAGGTAYYVVVSGDISGGNVTIRLRGKSGGGTNKVIRATSGEALTWYVINMGQ